MSLLLYLTSVRRLYVIVISVLLNGDFHYVSGSPNGEGDVRVLRFEEGEMETSYFGRETEGVRTSCDFSRRTHPGGVSRQSRPEWGVLTSRDGGVSRCTRLVTWFLIRVRNLRLL